MLLSILASSALFLGSQHNYPARQRRDFARRRRYRRYEIGGAVRHSRRVEVSV